jgi:predicted ATPase
VVELAAVTGADLVADAVARELPLPGFGGSPTDAVLAFLASRNLLLVLDNCEHVLAGAADLADRLLDAAPDVRALATSRVPLEITGEARFQLGPLPLAPAGAVLEDLLDADAVRLFVARARSARPRFGLDAANAPAVAAICRRLDGLPLALELAGARVGTLAPGDLLARLDASLSLLATDARGTPERHRTLEATLAWSYDLLTEEERILLARLAVFAGRFRLDWAEEICGFPPLAPGQVADLLDALAAKSLVAAEEVAARTEYGLLLTVREYAAPRLAERGEAEEAERRRAAFLIRNLTSTDPIFRFTAETGNYLAAVAAAADDVRASLSWCLTAQDADQACALIAAVYRWWNVTGRIAELCPLARQAVALPASPSFARVITYYALVLGLEASGLDSRAAGRAYADAMLAEARTLGDDNGLALALYCQADFPWAAGNYPAAARLFRQAAAAARRAGSGTLAAVISRSEAEARAAGDSAVLADSLGGVIGEFRRTSDPFGLAQTLAVLAGTELDCGRTAQAVAHAADGLRIAREHGYAEVGWRHLTLLAWSATALGDAEAGVRLLGAVEAALDRAGGKIGAGQGGPADRDKIRALAAAALGEERFTAAYAAGRALPEDEAAALALAAGRQS